MNTIGSDNRLGTRQSNATRTLVNCKILLSHTLRIVEMIINKQKSNHMPHSYALQTPTLLQTN